MKIIQHGRPKELRILKRFKCSDCGCIFEADKDEYKVGSKYNETYYFCPCPDCGKFVYEG